MYFVSFLGLNKSLAIGLRLFQVAKSAFGANSPFINLLFVLDYLCFIPKGCSFQTAIGTIFSKSP